MEPWIQKLMSPVNILFEEFRIAFKCHYEHQNHLYSYFLPWPNLVNEEVQASVVMVYFGGPHEMYYILAFLILPV